MSSLERQRKALRSAIIELDREWTERRDRVTAEPPNSFDDEERMRFALAHIEREYRPRYDDLAGRLIQMEMATEEDGYIRLNPLEYPGQGGMILRKALGRR